MPGAVSNQGVSASMGLTVGKLPSGGTHIAKQTRRLRTALEAAVLAARGQISITDASAINVACRAEMSAKLAQKWLIQHESSMGHGDKLSYAKALATASEQRHKAIQSLRLAPEDLDPQQAMAADWAAWEATQQHAAASEQPETSIEPSSIVEPSSEPQDCAQAMHDPDPFGPSS